LGGSIDKQEVVYKDNTREKQLENELDSIININERLHKEIVYLEFSKDYYSRQVENKQKLIDAVTMIETGFNNNAIGDNGKAFGPLQIHKACVQDVNRVYGTHYSHEDMFNPNKAEDVFFKYLEMGQELYKTKHGYYPSLKTTIRMWNGGIYSGYLMPQTNTYAIKVLDYLNSV